MIRLFQQTLYRKTWPIFCGEKSVIHIQCELSEVFNQTITYAQTKQS
ncbi:hypothetical protein NIES80_05090 [Dolichospermum planctonicum]|uniref:Uncharacterized protein n=1 Tax=Dolichospermum planctonicum TaxID=136072 RepID=A0A480A6Y5_9CYAN|nr:hypothetical protein NIES80_05090 [Dolichospermum planctonicum]